MNKFLKIFFWFLAIIIILLVVFFCYFFVGKAQIAKDIVWGVDFSQSQAEYLELDWKKLYSDIIYDLGVKNIKLHTNWSYVEAQKDKLDFSDIDWKIKQAEQGDVKIIYVLGLKTGRWPECHIPDWAQNLSEKEQKQELLDYIQQVILRYKDSKAVAFWQVENEPYFRFGECPNWYYQDKNFLQEEINLIRSLDPSRQIIVSDSGEQSMWFAAAKIGDIVGVTMYRKVWAHITDSFGFNINFPIPSVSYGRKAMLIKKIFGKDVVCIELQAEPWISKPLMEAPLEEQIKSMNLEVFRKNISFAKKTGLDTFYLWGVEWWYWLKNTENNPSIWNEAKKLF